MSIENRGILLAMLGVAALLIAGCMSDRPEESAVSKDLCQDSRISSQSASLPSQSPASNLCSSSAIKFQAADGLHEVHIAKVLKTSEISGDVVHNEYDTFVLLPDGSIASMGERAPVPISRNVAGDFLWKNLDIDSEAAGGACCIDHDLFYEPVLERGPDGFCVEYRMKAPFRGSFHQCAAREPMGGDIGYSAGAVSWKDALRIACARQTAETNAECSIKDLHIERDTNGSVYYAAKALFERREYRVAAATGAVTIKIHTY